MMKETKAKNSRTEKAETSAPLKAKEVKTEAPRKEVKPEAPRKEAAREAVKAEDLGGQIGEAAGLVWHYLKDHGATSASKLSEGTNLDRDSVQRAIGWLAREGKVAIERRGRNDCFALANP